MFSYVCLFDYFLMYLYKSFTHLKTTHSYHLVDPSPWRAADRCVEPFLTQKTQYSSFKHYLGKPLTRIFHLYTDNYLGLACQYVFLSTVGHTGKRIKRTFKPILSNTLKALTVVQIFQTGARLFFIGDMYQRILGTGIWYTRGNLWVYKHALRQITITNLVYWKGNGGGSKKQSPLLRQIELMNQ